MVMPPSRVGMLPPGALAPAKSRTKPTEEAPPRKAPAPPPARQAAPPSPSRPKAAQAEPARPAPPPHNPPVIGRLAASVRAADPRDADGSAVETNRPIAASGETPSLQRPEHRRAEGDPPADRTQQPERLPPRERVHAENRAADREAHKAQQRKVEGAERDLRGRGDNARPPIERQRAMAVYAAQRSTEQKRTAAEDDRAVTSSVLPTADAHATVNAEAFQTVKAAEDTSRQVAAGTTVRPTEEAHLKGRNR